MPITEAMRAERRKHLGSSDSAAILGLDPWRNAGDVYLSKLYEIEDEPSEQMQWGTLLEPTILDVAEKKLGKIARNVFRVCNQIFCANHDGIVLTAAGELDGGQGVEIKTSGNSDEWGEPGTDQIPHNYIVQCQHQMMVSDLRVVHVPVLLASHGLSLRFYRVERNDDLIAAIEEAGREFWERHVLTRTPPEGFAPSLGIAKRLKREPGTIAQVPAEPVVAWLAAKEAEKAAKQAAEDAQAVLLAFIGTAECADTPLGRITYFMQERAGFTVAPTSFRVLRQVKDKKETPRGKPNTSRPVGSAA